MLVLNVETIECVAAIEISRMNVMWENAPAGATTEPEHITSMALESSDRAHWPHFCCPGGPMSGQNGCRNAAVNISVLRITVIATDK